MGIYRQECTGRRRLDMPTFRYPVCRPSAPLPSHQPAEVGFLLYATIRFLPWNKEKRADSLQERTAIFRKRGLHGSPKKPVRACHRQVLAFPSRSEPAKKGPQWSPHTVVLRAARASRRRVGRSCIPHADVVGTHRQEPRAVRSKRRKLISSSACMVSNGW
jgi:hypothetical protein